MIGPQQLPEPTREWYSSPFHVSGIPEEPVPLTDDEAALRFAAYRWGEALLSPCCDRKLRQKRGRPKVFVCAGCRAHHSCTAGGQFHGTKLPARTLWRLLQAMARLVPPSANALSKELGIHVETAWEWAHRVRTHFAILRMDLRGFPFVNLSVWLPQRPPCRHASPYVPDAHPHLLVPHHHLDRCIRLAIVPTGPFVRAQPFDGWGSFMTRLAQDHPKVDPCGPCLPASREAVEPWISLITTQILEVHRTVSRRWLGRYLQFPAMRALGRGYHVREIYDVLDRHDTAPFRRVRPGGAARHLYDDATAFTVDELSRRLPAEAA